MFPVCLFPVNIGGGATASPMLLTLAACLTSHSGQKHQCNSNCLIQKLLHLRLCVVWMMELRESSVRRRISFSLLVCLHSSPRCSRTFRGHWIRWNKAKSESHPQILQTSLHFIIKLLQHNINKHLMTGTKDCRGCWRICCFAVGLRGTTKRWQNQDVSEGWRRKSCCS